MNKLIIAGLISGLFAMGAQATPTAVGAGGVGIGDSIRTVASVNGPGQSISFASNSQFAQTSATPLTAINSVTAPAAIPGTGTTSAAAFTNGTPGETAQITGSIVTSGEAIAGNYSNGAGATGSATSQGAAGALSQGIGQISDLPGGDTATVSGVAIGGAAQNVSVTTNQVAGNGSLVTGGYTSGINVQSTAGAAATDPTTETAQDYKSSVGNVQNYSYDTGTLASALFQAPAGSTQVDLSGISAGQNHDAGSVVGGAQASAVLLSPQVGGISVPGVGNVTASQAQTYLAAGVSTGSLGGLNDADLTGALNNVASALSH